MKNDALDELALDDILSRWHAWASLSTDVRGYARRSLVCGDYRVSRQYDDSNGALDSDLESSRMRDVDFCVTEMQEPHRSAIYQDARRLCTGVAVFISPRLPADRLERAQLIADARTMIAKSLYKAGIM